MRTRTRKILEMKPLAAMTMIGVLAANPLYSQAADISNLTEKDVAITRVAVKFGPQIVKQLRKKTSFSVPQSSLPADKRNAAVEQTYQRYVQMRSSFASAKNAGEWTSLGVSGSAALVAAVAGPQATVTVPALLVGAAISTLIDIGNEELEAVSQVQLRRLLKSKEGEILTDLGLTFKQLQENPDRASVAFSEGIEVFKDLRERAGGDEAVWKQSQDLIIQTFANTNQAQWDRIEANEDDIELVADFVVDLAEDLSEFKVEVNSRFENLEVAFNDLSGAVAGLEVAVADLDSRVGSLERDQAVISDFIFDEMPPAQKVRALRDRGFMAGRFSCAEGQDTCEASELKDSMIVRFEKEAKLQEVLGNAAAAAGALTSVGKIATDLGISSPELQSAVRIGNAAFGAFSGFMTGNYLGAISSVTGLFSKPSDPDAERFKVLMRFLQGQFKQINAKLDAILENQVKLMEALSKLSEQMRDGFQRVERRLANMDFEQRRISLGVRQLIWNDWKTCNFVYSTATGGVGGSTTKTDPLTLFFIDESSLSSVISNAGDAALDCLVTMQKNFGSLSATERFGNFIDLQWAIDERLTAAASLPGEDASEWRKLLLRFQEDVFKPIQIRFYRNIESNEDLKYANEFAKLARPVGTTDEWRAGLEHASKNPFDCNDNSGPDARIGLLLCAQGDQASDMAASRLLQTPILADVINDIANWVLVMAQLADVRDQKTGEFVRYEDLLSNAEAELDEGSSTGELMVEAAISVLDLGIASYAMLYGPDVAALLLEDLKAGGTAATSAVQLANANPFLGQNMTQLFLEERYEAEFPHEGRPRPSKTTYRAAYDLASRDQPGQFLLLQGLFGTDLEFALNERAEPTLVLSADDQKVLVPLPAPGEMSAARLSWPSRYYELLATRERLADRLISYRLLDDIEPDEQTYMTRLMTRPEN